MNDFGVDIPQVPIPEGYRRATEKEITKPVLHFAQKALQHALPIGKQQVTIVTNPDSSKRTVMALTEHHYDNHPPPANGSGPPFLHPGISILTPIQDITISGEGMSGEHEDAYRKALWSRRGIGLGESLAIQRAYWKARESKNPKAIFNVAKVLYDMGEIEQAQELMRRVSLFRGMREQRYGFGYSADYYSAVQTKLNVLGANPQLVVDGKWGKNSIAALKTFQKAKGLVVDGVPGTKSLAALGISAPTVIASSTMGHVAPIGAVTDADAYAIGKKAGAEIGLTEPEVQYVVTVARGEGGYGNGWAHPSAATIATSKQFGLTGYEGANSKNWGAVQGSGSAGSFMHVDHYANGTPYKAAYKAYASHEDAFKDVAKTILGGGSRKTVGAAEIKSAINEGNLSKAVFAQHANGYFELAPEKYLSAVVSNYNKIMSGVGWPKVLSENGITPAKAGMGIGLMLGLAALGIFLLRKPLIPAV